MVRLNLELPDSLSRSLAERAAREGQSPDEFVLHSLERILNEATEDPLLQVLGTLAACRRELRDAYNSPVSGANMGCHPRFRPKKP